MSLRFDRLMDDQEALQMNALQLAYLGDTVWEMIVRYDLIIQKLNVILCRKIRIRMNTPWPQALKRCWDTCT